MTATVGSPEPAPAGPPGERARPADGAVRDGEAVATDDLVIRQRIPLTIDPLGRGGGVIDDLVVARSQAVSHLFREVTQLHDAVSKVVEVLGERFAPPLLIGVLVQPDGTPVGPLQVQFTPSTLNPGDHKPPVTVISDEHGAFQLPMPPGTPLPDGSEVALVVHGGSGNNVTVRIGADQIAANGLCGTIALPQFTAPLPVSILSALENLVSPAPQSAPPPAPTNAPELPVVQIGTDDGCLLKYGANTSVDTFPYGVFLRLVEPRASIVSRVRPVTVRPGVVTYLPDYGTAFHAAVERPAPAREGMSPLALPETPDSPDGKVSYIDRVPVEQPISVDGFRDQIMGLQENGTFTGDETRPMAGTLGLGYVLEMSQRWTLLGLGLGDLVYSLPLAPGEQQQIAVFERVDTTRVSESEFFTEEQAQQQSAVADTSTHATFNSAFNESILGKSSFHTDSESSSWGGSLIIVSGGGGSSSANGNSSQSLQGQRDIAQQAAQNTHSAAENQAAARRSAARTGMRIATASESQQLTTRTVTNHNHAHALTMQYWEVQRLYDVTTAIDGLTLTVLVPLQVIRFMPPGQPATLTDPKQVSSRGLVLRRYAEVIKHSDVLAQALPRRFRHGLTMLQQFAADPLASVEPAGGAAEDVVSLRLSGTFLRCEDVYVTVVTDRGTRVGPVKLANPAPQIPADTFETREQLVEWLTGQRQDATTTLTGALALPSSMSRANVVGFEITRSFNQVAYTLISAAYAAAVKLESVFGAEAEKLFGPSVLDALRRETVFLSPADLERALGGPRLAWFTAGIEERDGQGQPVPNTGEQYANESLGGVELPQQPYPVPARQLAPVLRYNEILEIERMAAHVVRNTLTYSRAVWASLSDDERAVLLEAYTIGVPKGGVADATQMVPLLNCVENRVLGYFGNSMILPFIIPQALTQQDGAGGTGLDPVRLHDALLAYQRTTFAPPHSTIALPTRGVLAEAVLGHCPSAEKVDIRRFWNWQDSPSDTAPTISPTQLPTGTPSLTAGVTAPNSLTNLPSLINNVLTAPTPDNALLQSLAQAAAAQKDFDSGLTGAKDLAGLVTNAQNTANLARADALKTTKELTAQAMATVGNIVGAKRGAPDAGSKAAAAVQGKGDGSSSTPAGTTGEKKAPTPGGTKDGGGTTGGGTGGGTTGGGSTGGGSTGGGPSGGPGPGPSGGPTTGPTPGPRPATPGSES